MLPAHALVLYACSSFFRRSLVGQFKEAQSKQYEFDEGKAQAYWRVFEYMYTNEYSDEPAPSLGDDGE